MTGRVLPLRASTHRVVDAMLPWYVNGTLDPDERDMVQRHVDECLQCRSEVEWLRELHAACVACVGQDRDAPALTGLRRRLEERPAAQARPVRGVWAALPLGWRAAAVAQFCVIGALAWLAFAGHDTAAGYRTLGAPDGMMTSGNVVVVFAAQTPEAEMRRVLNDAGARIVDGPTSTNGYVLAVPAERETAALRRLQASPSVTLAQALAAQTPR
jgi:anti-sigma factor RsiW